MVKPIVVSLLEQHGLPRCKQYRVTLGKQQGVPACHGVVQKHVACSKVPVNETSLTGRGAVWVRVSYGWGYGIG